MSEPTVPPTPPPTQPPSSAPPPPPPGGAAGGESPNRGLMIVLSYLWILAVIPLVAEKDDKEVQWHAKHGLVLLIAEIILSAVIMILSQIPFLGCVIVILWFVVWVGIVILHIVCILKGVKGERLLIPYVSQYADRF